MKLINNQIKIKIEKSIYNNNLLFYTILKLLIKCKFTDKQLILLQDSLNKNFNLNKNKIKEILLNSLFLIEKTQKYEDFSILLNTIEFNDLRLWKDILEISIDLMLIKDLIIQESKVYANNQYKELIKNINDKLSLKYDLSKLNIPYGQRVISSLLIYILTETINRKTEYVLYTNQQNIKKISDKIKNITNNYKINCNNMFLLLINESINQSIISDAGQSYESRVKEVFLPFVDKFLYHTHDSNILSVEYDFIFEIDKYKCGVSAKRTLRERYKQNFENVNLLNVDCMFLVTLGTDLNKDKLNNILQKQGIYIVVAQEIYDSKIYMQNCDRVISSKNINRNKLYNILHILNKNN